MKFVLSVNRFSVWGRWKKWQQLCLSMHAPLYLLVWCQSKKWSALCGVTSLQLQVAQLSVLFLLQQRGAARPQRIVVHTDLMFLISLQLPDRWEVASPCHPLPLTLISRLLFRSICFGGFFLIKRYFLPLFARWWNYKGVCISLYCNSHTEKWWEGVEG